MFRLLKVDKIIGCMVVRQSNTLLKSKWISPIILFITFL